MTPGSGVIVLHRRELLIGMPEGDPYTRKP
jgi:hypothetical protein